MQKSYNSALNRRQFFRQGLLLAGTAVTFAGPWRHRRVYAAASDKPIKIGLTHDATGQYGVSGQAEYRGTVMAIEEANARGGVLGRKIEYTWQDTRTDPRIGAQLAEQFINDQEVNFLAGAIHSDVAESIAQVAQKYGCVYLNTNSSSPTQSGENCHRVKFVFDANGENFARASIQYALEKHGRRWLLLTNDYSWGHRTAEAIRARATALGAEITDEILVPVGTRNYIGILRRVGNVKPDVVATAIGGDDYIPLRAQAVDLGLHKTPVWLNNQQDWPDHYALAQASNYGIFGTTWYYRLDLPGVADLVQRYRQRWSDTFIKVPGNVFYNGYTAMRALLGAIETAGTTNNHQVIKTLEQLRIPAAERMQHFDAYMNPDTHHLQQTIYIAASNDQPQEGTDYWKILNWLDPKDVVDPGKSNCSLEPLSATPTYEI